MNQPAGQSPLGGAQQPMQPKTPVIAPWLLIVFLIALLIGAGFFGWQYLKKITTVYTPPDKVPTDIFPPLSSTDATSTADWKTYTNDTYNYSIKYPADWIYQEDSTIKPETKFISPETAKLPDPVGDEAPAKIDFSISYYDNISALNSDSAKYTTLDNFMNDKTSSRFSGVNKITFAEQAAYEATEGGMGAVYEIWIEKNSHIFEIFFYRRGTKAELSAIENQILSTFQFIP